MVLLDHAALARDTSLEVKQEFTDFLIVEINFLAYLLDVYALQEVALLSFFLVSGVAVSHQHFPFVVHSDVFKPLAIYEQRLVLLTQEEVLLLIPLLVESPEHLSIVLEGVLCLQSLQLDVDIN